jgi:hypothetical protein
MNKRKNYKRKNLLTFEIIEAAARGEITAINKVLKHYEGYIIALSTKQIFDERGKPYMVIDTETRRFLETTLIVKIMQFDTRRAA